MENKIKNLSMVVILLFTFSYLLNFIWESFHAVFLYNGHNFEAIKYVSIISYVSMIDGFLILGVYAITSLTFRNFLWIKRIKKIQTSTFIISGLILAIWIEYRAVFLLERWSYNELMPTIFGIGLSPLVQLGISGIIALLITKRLIYGGKPYV